MQAKLKLINHVHYALIDDNGNDLMPSIWFNRHQFAGTGKKADGTRFDTAQDLKLTKLTGNHSSDYLVTDVDYFLAQMQKLWDSAKNAEQKIWGVDDWVDGVNFK